MEKNKNENTETFTFAVIILCLKSAQNERKQITADFYLDSMTAQPFASHKKRKKYSHVQSTTVSE